MLVPGLVLVAPGDRHLLVREHGAGYRVELRDGPRIGLHKPSVDVMFRSVAEAAKGDAMGVILTGMGRDGAAGPAQMKAAGAHTIAQDEATCVVFGMPREAAAGARRDRVRPRPDSRADLPRRRVRSRLTVSAFLIAAAPAPRRGRVVFPERLQPVGAARRGADDGDDAQDDDGEDRQGQRQEVQGHRMDSRGR